MNDREYFSMTHTIIFCCLMLLMRSAPRLNAGAAAGELEAVLPPGVSVQWNISKAWRETTPTRERICINGLWRWQPATDQTTDQVPTAHWGFFKVPGSWPGITSYMQKDSQTVHPHPAWRQTRLSDVTAAWYQREISIPDEWTGRRVSLTADYVNSYAVVFINEKRVGEIRYPAGEIELTQICKPGNTYVLSMLVVALPLKGVMLSYTDTASAKQVKGTVDRRGLCGDVFITSTPLHNRIVNARVFTSVRLEEIAVKVSLEDLVPGEKFVRARVKDAETTVIEFDSPRFDPEQRQTTDLQFGTKWRPSKLWDVHTPQNMYELQLELHGPEGVVLDQSPPIRFGYREFWIDGRDFYLNGTRIHLCALPFDNAQVGAAAATYTAARESMERLRTLGINFVYTHNYGCEPGAHLSFDEILRAADDVGMLIALSQPHFSHYDWSAPDAEKQNGYAEHAAFYVRVAGNHPSVVMYSTSHNSAGYADDMNPDKIDGRDESRDQWSANNAKKALRAEAIIRSLDPSRIVYHHACGNLGAMHTSNFYPNFTPEQELSDWFEHWATTGVKPLFLCEYGAPFSWDWAMYRGWYKGKREFGSAVVPWEFCLAEWNAQFFGDRAFEISEAEKRNLRWEAAQFRAGRLWHRWDYPHQLGSTDFPERDPVFAMYYWNNWRAYRTWGVSATSPWEHNILHRLRPGVDRNRRVELPVDWDNLQRPGFSPDYLQERYERMDLAYERSDWIPTVAAEALAKNNRPLLAWIAGKPDAFTSKDHIYLPGEQLQKQIIVINDSRELVRCNCLWTLSLPTPITGSTNLSVQPGQQARVPLTFRIPDELQPGRYTLSLQARFDTGEPQEDQFIIDIVPRTAPPVITRKISVFDPKGETTRMLQELGVQFSTAQPDTKLHPSDVLVIGKGAIDLTGPAPDVSEVRNGLRVLIFEQAPDVLEKRFGFRIAEYGLRKVFARVPDSPALAGLEPEHFENWRGEATLVPRRVSYALSRKYNMVPVAEWCGLEVPRIWRCGCRGNVASVSIEKPACGDFLPLVDGGYSLQYSQLMEYREGAGVVVFCQMDVTGRTEKEPAADKLAANLIRYICDWKPTARRQMAYLGPPNPKAHLEAAGFKLSPLETFNAEQGLLFIAGPIDQAELATHRERVRELAAKSTYILAVGIDQAIADILLPCKITFAKQEHINSYFEPARSNSPFCGVGPADVHCRDPRMLFLAKEGGERLGNGIATCANNGTVVVCQLAPWDFDYKRNFGLKRTFRRVSYLLTRLMCNLGVECSTPLLRRISTPVSSAEKGRWLEGLYLDQPEEWDDPYRFFRW